MNLTEDQIQDFVKRIDKVNSDLKPKFGKMNVNQMVSHCSDFFRMAKGIKKAEEYGKVDPQEIIRMARARLNTPTPRGFGQIEGGGTTPTDLENDKNILKEFLLDFARLDKEYEFAEHPFFGNMNNQQWVDLAIYHLNHHLKQFGV